METKEKLKETLELINTVEEMKDALDWHSCWDKVKERTPELKVMATETSETGLKKEQMRKREQYK